LGGELCAKKLSLEVTTHPAPKFKTAVHIYELLPGYCIRFRHTLASGSVRNTYLSYEGLCSNQTTISQDIFRIHWRAKVHVAFQVIGRAHVEGRLVFQDIGRAHVEGRYGLESKAGMSLRCEPLESDMNLCSPVDARG